MPVKRPLNPQRVRRKKTSYGQDIVALNQRNAPPEKGNLTNTTAGELSKVNVRPAQEPVVPNMDKYSIAEKRLGRHEVVENNNFQSLKNIYSHLIQKPKIHSDKEELIELVCLNCRYKVAVRGDLKVKIIESLNVEKSEDLFAAIDKNKEKFKCTKCKSKNVTVLKNYICDR